MLCPCCLHSLLVWRADSAALCGLQTVPACQELYRNSFTYHTVRTSPPDFQECFGFLGASWPPRHAATAAASGTLSGHRQQLPCAGAGMCA